MKAVGYILAGCVGACAGGAGVYFYMKKKEEQRVEEVRKEAKEFYNQMYMDITHSDGFVKNLAPEFVDELNENFYLWNLSETHAFLKKHTKEKVEKTESEKPTKVEDSTDICVDDHDNYSARVKDKSTKTDYTSFSKKEADISDDGPKDDDDYHPGAYEIVDDVQRFDSFDYPEEKLQYYVDDDVLTDISDYELSAPITIGHEAHGILRDRRTDKDELLVLNHIKEIAYIIEVNHMAFKDVMGDYHDD